jgi:hypothetical protein
VTAFKEVAEEVVSEISIQAVTSVDKAFTVSITRGPIFDSELTPIISQLS